MLPHICGHSATRMRAPCYTNTGNILLFKGGLSSAPMRVSLPHGCWFLIARIWDSCCLADVGFLPDGCEPSAAKMREFLPQGCGLPSAVTQSSRRDARFLLRACGIICHVDGINLTAMIWETPGSELVVDNRFFELSRPR